MLVALTEVEFSYLSRMDNSVASQVTLGNKSLRTFRANERLPPGMNPHVFRKIRVPTERLEAHVASERFNSRVNYSVFPQVGPPRKRPVALGATVGLIVLMNALQVRGILQSVREPHVTLRAGIGHRMIVGRALVGGTLRLIGERLVAELAHGDVSTLERFARHLVLVVAVPFVFRFVFGIVIQRRRIDHHDNVVFLGFFGEIWRG